MYIPFAWGAVVVGVVVEVVVVVVRVVVRLGLEPLTKRTNIVDTNL